MTLIYDEVHVQPNFVKGLLDASLKANVLNSLVWLYSVTVAP